MYRECEGTVGMMVSIAECSKVLVVPKTALDEVCTGIHARYTRVTVDLDSSPTPACMRILRIQYLT